MNLFLALLLSSFAGLNDTDEEEDEGEPKPTRLQRLMEWSKKLKQKRKDKKKNKENNANTLIVNGGDDEEKKDLPDGEESGDKDFDGRATLSDPNNPESMVCPFVSITIINVSKEKFSANIHSISERLSI